MKRINLSKATAGLLLPLCSPAWMIHFLIPLCSANPAKAQLGPIEPPIVRPDCNQNGVIDDEDIALGTSADCNDNGIPDECELACQIEIVYVLDTSGSMTKNPDLCRTLIHVIEDLQQNAQVTASLLGITANPPSECSSPEFRFTGNVSALLDGAVPGNGSCGPLDVDDPDHEESWGPATAIVAQEFVWVPEAVRVVIPISDEGPCEGGSCDDPVKGPHRDSVTNAIQVANQNGVTVFPITGVDPIQSCVKDLADDLALGTGGEAFHLSEPMSEPMTLDQLRVALGAALNPLTIDPNCVDNDCNNNGVPDECDSDCNGDGFVDGCEPNVVVTISEGPGPQSTCIVTLNVTQDRETDCTSGLDTCENVICQVSANADKGADGATPSDLAAALAANSGDCATNNVTVKAHGPRVVFKITTPDPDTPRPRICVALGNGEGGLVGGPDRCEQDRCDFHFQIGLRDDQTLPTIAPGIDHLTTTMTCANTTDGVGTWMEIEFPAGMFDRPGLPPAKPIPTQRIAFSGVGVDFSNSDEDTIVERTEAIDFGICSGDFSAAKGGSTTRDSDCVVNNADQESFDACFGNPGLDDCDFFDYDGDGDIDDDDGDVFDCLANSANNVQCCPENLNLPQEPIFPTAIRLRRLHLRSCDPLLVPRVFQNDWPECWWIDYYISNVPPSIGGPVGCCADQGTTPPHPDAGPTTGDYELNLAVAERSTITVTQYSTAGGTFDSKLLVQALTTFSRVADPFATVMIDSGELGEDAVALYANDVPWVNTT